MTWICLGGRWCYVGGAWRSNASGFALDNNGSDTGVRYTRSLELTQGLQRGRHETTERFRLNGNTILMPQGWPHGTARRMNYSQKCGDQFLVCQINMRDAFQHSLLYLIFS